MLAAFAFLSALVTLSHWSGARDMPRHSDPSEPSEPSEPSGSTGHSDSAGAEHSGHPSRPGRCRSTGRAKSRTHLPSRKHRSAELGHFLHDRGTHVWRRGKEVELMHRAMGFAALGLVTLAPLLIVVAAALPIQERGFALWIVDGMGLSGRPADAVQDVFAAPGKVLSTTSVLSVVLLALFGVTFAGSVQTGYEKVWDLPAGRWHTVWRRVVWLVALTAYLFAEAQSVAVLGSGTLRSSGRIGLSALLGWLFFWWGQRFLLGGRIPWRALLPGAIATVVGLGGLRLFSSLVFSPLIVSNAVSYGSVGTVLIVTSWLIGVGFVVFGGALLGRYWYVHEPHHVPHPHPHRSRNGSRSRSRKR
ncbi:membrane protein [Streptomyces umbrinus]|uniref:Membrane protein n=2 Tax=Streptomyces umbrinus TaxID=67370 RepID=A0ABU0SI41_9ACTN|nr:membrane protein [Streptomyces umbrinus]